LKLRRRFNRIESRPGTRRAFAQGELMPAQPATTEMGKQPLFGKKAASVDRT
jgi:hypothetical protein